MVKKLEEKLKEDLKKINGGEIFSLKIEHGNNGIFGFRKKSSKIVVVINNVENDISFSAEVEKNLRLEYGYGTFEKSFHKMEKKLVIGYTPLQEFSPGLVIKSINKVVDSTMKSHEKRREVYVTPGINN